jgi:small-conductance mechanosensitive channel
VDPSGSAPKGYPLRFDGQFLLDVYSRLDTLSPQERISIIQDRLDYIANSGLPIDLKLARNEHGVSVMFETSPVLTVTEADAKALNAYDYDKAEEYRKIVEAALLRYRTDRSASNITTAIISAVAILIAAVGIGIGVIRIAGLWEHNVIGSLNKSERRSHSFHRAINSLRNLVLAMIGFVAGTWAFSLVPMTRGFTTDTTHLFQMRLHEIRASIESQTDNLSYLVTIIAITWLVLVVTRAIFDAAAVDRLNLGAIDAELAGPTYRILRVFIVLVAIVAAYPYIPGSSTPAFQGISVFLGALFSLGSSNVVGNLVAGLLSTYTLPFRLGDRVKIGNTEGFIIGKSDVVTRVRTLTNIEVTIPNSMLLSEAVYNLSAAARADGLIVPVSVIFTYDVPAPVAHGVLMRAASRTDKVLTSPAPFVIQTALNNVSASYELRVFTRECNQLLRLTSELMENVEIEFREAGIDLNIPNITIIRESDLLEQTGSAPSWAQPERSDQRTNEA